MILKKPKFWDYKKPNVLAYLLFPIATLIQIFAFFQKKSKKKKFNIKTICIGNIYVGGTGKTSLSIKINKILNKKNLNSCIIKKFYNSQIDEQNILKNNGKIFISSSRIDAISKAESQNYKFAILDDGLQDASIICDTNIVCFNNINWIGNGMTIPAGPLRESVNSLKKYNHIFLNGNMENLDFLKKKILKINSKIQIHIGEYKPVNIDEFDKSDNYLIFSGIGNHETFISMIKKNKINVICDLEFPDHYKYLDSDIKNILSKADNLNCRIITTEKDYYRINKIYYDKIKCIRSELQIIDEDKFIESII